MTRTLRITLSATLALACAALGFALPKDASFSVQGLEYVAEVSGRGATEAEAQNDALSTAIAVIMESLGKDRLFSELFIKNPPVTMSWKRLSSEKGLSSWVVRLRLSVDDESLRLLYNTAYLSTVSTMLDGAESRLGDAERLAGEARGAETDGQIARAMSLYWQAKDACDGALDLLSPLGDAAVFSTRGKRKAPELREIVTAVRTSVVSGYERMKTVGASLAADEELASAVETLERIEVDVAAIEAWSGGLAKRAERVESMERTALKALSDELAVKERILADSRLALGRVEDSVPKSKELVRARIDVARRRIDSLTAYFSSTKGVVDKELRDPAIARARRSQAIRWIFLHEPSGALSLRLYTPFGLDPGASDIRFADTGFFEFGARAEQAFGSNGGVWIATDLSKVDYPRSIVLESEGALNKGVAYSQSIDLGFYGKTLVGAGFGWDWLHLADGEALERRLSLRALVGGVSTATRQASWLAALSWEFPYERDEFLAANVFNAGLDVLGRPGGVLELLAGISLRPRPGLGEELDGVLRYRVGAGFRLPRPFLWGLEFYGYRVSSLAAPQRVRSDQFLRMFVEYSF